MKRARDRETRVVDVELTLAPLLSVRAPFMGTAWRGLPVRSTVVVRVRGARCSEHAQNISKWHPTMSLATECAEKVGSKHKKLR